MILVVNAGKYRCCSAVVMRGVCLRPKLEAIRFHFDCTPSEEMFCRQLSSGRKASPIETRNAAKLVQGVTSKLVSAIQLFVNDTVKAMDRISDTANTAIRPAAQRRRWRSRPTAVRMARLRSLGRIVE